MRPWFRSRTTRIRGAALLFTLAFITSLFFLGVGYLNLVPSELRAGFKNRQDVTGYFVADAGVVHAMAWLEHQLSRGAEPGVTLDEYKGVVEMDGDWSFKVRIQPDSQTAPRGNNPVRSYLILSEAFENEVPRRLVTVRVVQQSFARYAMFVDSWPSNIVYNLGTRGLDGPLHTNAVMRMNVPYRSYWQEKNADPMFMGRVTSSKVFHNRSHGSAQDGMAYYQGNYSGNTEWKRPYSKDGPISSRYQRMIAGGRENLVAGVKEEKLPPTSVELAQAAWGWEVKGKPPTTQRGKPSVRINPGGGIFINGQAEQMRLSVENGNSVTTILQDKKRTETKVVEVKERPLVVPAGSILNGKRLQRSTRIPVNSTVMMVKGGRSKRLTVTSVKGLPNGVIYSNGDILNLAGENKGRKTIAVEVKTSRKIFIGGNLTAQDTKPGTSPKDNRDALGLVGYDVMVSKTIPRHTTSERRPLYIYAQIMSGREQGSGGFGVEDYNRGFSRGYMEIYGGISQSRLKPWAVLGGGGMSGKIIYNPHSAASPPPFFPTIAKFRIRAYLEESVK